ncbi:MAG: biotin transporter BioY [Acidobacteriota bacterium]
MPDHPKAQKPPSRPRRELAYAALGVLAVAVGGRLDVPMVPVPMSLQTYAVGVVGGLAGPRRGGAILGLYLAAGALGAPVFADGAGGVGHLTGPTAGYLLGFALAAVGVGALAERGWMSTARGAFAAMALGHVLVLGLGAAWLAAVTDPATAYRGGFEPFLLGAAVKSALAAATVRAVKARTIPPAPDL